MFNLHLTLELIQNFSIISRFHSDQVPERSINSSSRRSKSLLHVFMLKLSNVQAPVQLDWFTPGSRFINNVVDTNRVKCLKNMLKPRIECILIHLTQDQNFLEISRDHVLIHLTWNQNFSINRRLHTKINDH